MNKMNATPSLYNAIDGMTHHMLRVQCSQTKNDLTFVYLHTW